MSLPYMGAKIIKIIRAGKFCMAVNSFFCFSEIIHHDIRTKQSESKDRVITTGNDANNGTMGGNIYTI